MDCPEGGVCPGPLEGLPVTPSSPTFFARFTRLLRPVFHAETRGRLLGLLAVALGLKLAIVGLNVVNSFVNRYFINSLIQREVRTFFHCALLYLAAFAVLSVAGALAVYTEELLGLRWREWLTRYFFDSYLADRRYYDVERHANVDNPDQRIAEDIHTYTGTTLSLALVLFDSTISLVSFVSVLWSITPWLVLTAVCYAAVGSAVTWLVGGRLVTLNFLQFKKEADLRYALSRVREHAEAVALLGAEGGERRRLVDRLVRVVDNTRHVIAVNRNLRVFVSLYGYLTPVLPFLIVAPFYLSGRVTDFGALTQAAMAFPFVLGAFSVLINQFGPISTLAAVTNRLGGLCETLQTASARSCVSLELRPGPVRARDVTILAHQGGEVLVEGLSFEVPPGGRLLVVGPLGSGKTSLFRALAGLECQGGGEAWRPADTMFLPQRPYSPAGTLRHLLTYTAGAHPPPDEKLLEALQAVQFAPLLHGRCHLDDQKAWGEVLSVGEQQQVAFARLLLGPPSFAFLDDALSALDDPEAQRLYGLLSGLGIGLVTFCERSFLAPYHDRVLELTGAGHWRYRAAPSAAAG
jgi:putative ATP-binding cassette transporter